MTDKECDIFCGCLYFAAHELARLMTDMAEEEFASTGLSPSHAFLLMLVNDSPGINPLELSSKLKLKPSTITRFVDRLVYKGLVERRPAGKNVQLVSTAKGQALQPDIKASWSGLYSRYAAIIGNEPAKEMTAGINEINRKLSSINTDGSGK